MVQSSHRGRNLRFLSSSECWSEVAEFCISHLGCVTYPTNLLYLGFGQVKSRKIPATLGIAVMESPQAYGVRFLLIG